MPLNSYSDVQNFFNGILNQNVSTSSGNTELKDTKNNAPHADFWNTLTYDQFVNGNVPGVNPPMKILIKGNSAQSNIILALSGATGTAFDPNTGSFGPMPADGPPMFTPAQIQELADWIDKGCPK